MPSQRRPQPPGPDGGRAGRWPPCGTGRRRPCVNRALAARGSEKCVCRVSWPCCGVSVTASGPRPPLTGGEGDPRARERLCPSVPVCLGWAASAPAPGGQGLGNCTARRAERSGTFWQRLGAVLTSRIHRKRLIRGWRATRPTEKQSGEEGVWRGLSQSACGATRGPRNIGWSLRRAPRAQLPTPCGCQPWPPPAV